LICRHRLDEWSSIESPVCVQERSALGDEIRISEIKRAVEIPEVGVTQIFEDSERVTHRRSCRRSAAAVAAMSSGISVYWREAPRAATPLYEGGDPEHMIRARSIKNGGRQLAGIKSVRVGASYRSTWRRRRRRTRYLPTWPGIRPTTPLQQNSTWR
jgi:hypothetical protein